MPTYLEIFHAVHGCGADYAWMGLTAAAVYGSPLVSYDFDFFIRPDASHLDKAREAFRRLGMTDSMAGVSSGNVIAAEGTVTFSDPFGGASVDLMTHISGPGFEEVWGDHQVREYAGVRIRIASLEHIIASKKAANREKDQYAIKRLKDELGWEIKESNRRYRARKKKRV